MSTKRPLPQSNQERVYVFDKDYRCDLWGKPDLYDQSSLTFKEQPSVSRGFPHAEMTLAVTYEMKNCNPKPLQIMTEGNQTLLPQQTTTVNAVVIPTNANDVTEAVPQFDEAATIIIAPALATAHNKKINIRMKCLCAISFFTALLLLQKQ